MKEKQQGGFKLSPNEEARLLQQARELQRKKRLLQVREQAKVNAARVRLAVKHEKKKQIEKLAKGLETEWEAEKSEKVDHLQSLYTANVQCVGEGHHKASHHEPVEEQRALLAAEDKRRAALRHQMAIQQLHDKQAQEEEEANRHIISRQTALEAEKARAAAIAALPPPPPDPLFSVQAPKIRPIKFTDLDAFSSTHLHMPELCHVERAQAGEVGDARLSAKTQRDMLEEEHMRLKRDQHERQEKARLRHKQALQKEILKNEYDTMLHDLSDLQREDKHRRQNIVAKIPKQIFLPPHRKLAEKEEAQNDMEQAFENMYMAATDFLGDLSLALDPHPPPETPTATESLELSVLDTDDLTQEKYEGSSDSQVPSQSSGLQDITNKHPVTMQSNAKTPEGLQRLLGRIKSQRDNWLQQSSAVPADSFEERPSP